MVCSENLADHISKSKCDRLTVAIDACIEVELSKPKNILEDCFQLRLAPLYCYPISVRHLPTRVVIVEVD